MSCVFCDIATGETPAEFLYKGPTAVVFVPLNPVTDGHVLVVPRVHVDDFLTDPLVTADLMGEAARYAHQIAAPGINLITSAGAAATQTVFHLHVHLVPRFDRDGLHLPWTGQ